MLGRVRHFPDREAAISRAAPVLSPFTVIRASRQWQEGDVMTLLHFNNKIKCVLQYQSTVSLIGCVQNIFARDGAACCQWPRQRASYL